MKDILDASNFTREQMLGWLKSLDIDPSDVPLDALWIHPDEMKLYYRTFVRDEEGGRVISAASHGQGGHWFVRSRLIERDITTLPDDGVLARVAQWLDGMSPADDTATWDDYYNATEGPTE